MENIFKINDIDYECEFKLSNPDNQEVKFTKSAVRGMTIVDNIFDPFLNGSITIANPFDFIEDEYFIRGDGRDKFLVKFKPKDSKGWKDLGFEHTFAVVNDSNSVNPLTRAENFKTFSLLSEYAIPFMDKIPYGKVFSGKVGDILKDIFKEVLGEELVDEEEWQSGDFEIIEYYPPATFRYMDLIRYFMRLFYAKDDDIYVKGFINFEPSNKKYQLRLISKIFKEHKKNEMEAFLLGDLVTNIGFNNPNNPPSGPDTGEYIGMLKNVGYSTPLYTWTTDYFLNSLVIGYDRLLGQQKMKRIKFDDIKKKWKKKFVDSFTAIGGETKAFAVKNKATDEKFKRYKFPYPVDNGVKIVESEIHNALTFYNLQLSFSNIGNTARSSGKFIDIVSGKKIEKNKPLKSDSKLLGRWYVTELRHVFFADLYTNQIFATKTYIGPNENITEDVE